MLERSLHLFPKCHVLCYCMASLGAPLTNCNDGEVRQRFTFYTQKNHNFRICLPKKKIATFFSIPKKIPLSFFPNPKKSVFSRPQKIAASFIDPKKSPRAKISDPKKSLGPPPPVIKTCEGGSGMASF